MRIHHRRPPGPWGLYDPQTEHDACGVGFVAHIRGEKSRAIVEQGLEILNRLRHRGATGFDPETGDGAGILLQLPHRFFKRVGKELGFDMPRRRRYAVGMVFFPAEPDRRAACERVFEQVIAEEGQNLLGWRDVPIAAENTGRVAREVMPVIRQVYIARRRLVPSAFERKLYVIRKLTHKRIRETGIDPEERFHVASLSAETIVYKGLLLPEQLPRFYPDLSEPDMVSAIALVHSRFSTNTFPTWDLAQPFRFIAHNGEINTLRGNRNWMNARKSQLESAKFGGSLDRLNPIIVPGRSDSAQFDNMLELLHLGGRPLPHAMMMMIPEAWERHGEMSQERKDFYRYASALLEPWDGPAAIAFTDGRTIGATLDRNGLRPARYVVTDDDRVILASEAGVIDVPPDHIIEKGRLTPGKMLLVDTVAGKIADDEEVKHEIASRWPYGRWLKENVHDLADFPAEPNPPPPTEAEDLSRLQRAFGYSDEDVRLIIGPMAEDGKEPLGSMGTDTPLAVLSQTAPNLSAYFHQLFAQVTNPPIDPIREALVMSLETTLGPDGNTFEETPDQCHRIQLPGPILTNAELSKIAAINVGVFEPAVFPILFEVAAGPRGLAEAVEKLCADVLDAIDDGHNVIILSDRGVDARRAPIPALLAVSAVHQHLVREGTRMQAGLVVETAEAREVHDFALLIGYGAAAVNPYLALDTVRALAESGEIAAQSPETAIRKYIDAIGAGLLKVMSKMGISTLRSYSGAQIFEAVGLRREVIDRYFAGTPSRIGGASIEDLGREALARHDRGFGRLAIADVDPLPVGGHYRWRRRGEHHKWNPATVAVLQAAIQQKSRDKFAEYSRLVDDENHALCTLRGLLDFDRTGVQPVPLDEVEPATEIVKRFVTGAMSFGSISAEAHETLAIAMNRIGGKSNSGEGGEEARRYTPDANGDLRRSAVKQVASGRFGVTAHYLVNADDLQIKVAQGAKPGEGGQLPGHKVDERIAKVRHSTPGVMLISPPPHHDIYSIEDLAQLIYDLQSVNPSARVSVKLVSEVGVGTVAAGVAKAGAGCVVIAGYEGGTGASPLSSIKHAGLPWELGIAEAQQVLVQNNLRGRVRLQVDGGLRTGRDVAIAALLGAEEFGMATASLVAVGCIMLRKCHLNTCSVGIATQDPELRKRFAGTPDDVVQFFMMVAEEVRALMASLGFRRMDEMVGRADRLTFRIPEGHSKASHTELAGILALPDAPREWPRHCVAEHRNPLARHLDRDLVSRAEPALSGDRALTLDCAINNTNRSVGALLSGEIARRHGEKGLPEESLHVRFSGSAGQSFAAFLVPGVTFELCGEANDYVGKGLSGGRVAVYPPPGIRFAPEDNIIIGNTALYGATSGQAFISGTAGERFAVRNSGAVAVVEGVGDHGCEYMTGGTVVILGRTGRNFAAGMSGGIAYVFDRQRTFRDRVNRGMVELESVVSESDMWLVYGLIEDHVRHTRSPLGQRILDNWEQNVSHFIKVMPIDYKRVLQARRARSRPRPSPRLQVMDGGKG